ncbi:uncharacterized protein LOC125580655 isoform X2 [Brassica napus]|uniref:uncharacterized protein LOC125580655 isoform X2 n=1 Tax=Brassica napus TaxID=3708 RepID=UPI002078A40F|nr:uncharacterized protein LOC125580655 isoform X2 [Brassica napus]
MDLFLLLAPLTTVHRFHKECLRIVAVCEAFSRYKNPDAVRQVRELPSSYVLGMLPVLKQQMDGAMAHAPSSHHARVPACHDENAVGVARYRVEMLVIDVSDTAVFVTFDEDRRSHAQITSILERPELEHMFE